MFKYIIASFICLISTCSANFQLGESLCSTNNCYIITEQLGEGAFGKVYKVTDSQGKDFALKTYKHNESEGSSFWNLLSDSERELQRGQKLNHKNIIKSIELFTDTTLLNEQRVNLILQFVQGNTLNHIDLDSSNYQETQQAILHFIDAVRHAASRDLFHLDLHGGNIMITDTEDSMLIDLASFFTMSEILNLASQLLENNHDIAQKDIFTQTHDPLLPREVKIKKFFENRPELLKALAEESEHVNTVEPFEKNAEKKVNDKHKKELILHNNFRDVASMCEYILDTTTLDSEQKNRIIAKVESLKNSYEKSIKNKKVGQFNNYLDRLSNAFLK